MLDKERSDMDMYPKQVFFYDGNQLSKEEYIREIGLTGYEKIYTEVQKKMDQDHSMNSLYLIQLFDYNCPNCVSGVTKVFVEDIDRFADIYQSIEKDEARINRFLRSKAGEIVTDYYSEDPALNIVQKIDIDDLGGVMTWGRDKTISVVNGYGWPSEYYFKILMMEIRWVKIKEKYYKLVRPSGRDCCHKSFCDEQMPWRQITVVGNPFWIYEADSDIPYMSANIDDFKGIALESYVWQIADVFDTEEEMKAERALFSERSLSEEQVSRVFADIPGDAG